MKALVSIQFALELDDEDDLVTLAQQLDEGMFESIKRHLESGMDRDAVEAFEDSGQIDWYGASVTVKRSVFNPVGGGE